MRFAARVSEYGRLFLILMVAIGAAAIVSAISGNLLGVGTALILLGITLVAFPFSTPETVALLGVARAVFLARGFGAIVALLGVATLANTLR